METDPAWWIAVGVIGLLGMACFMYGRSEIGRGDSPAFGAWMMGVGVAVNVIPCFGLGVWTTVGVSVLLLLSPWPIKRFLGD